MTSFGIPELILVIPVAAFVFAYLIRRLQTQERLRAIEKGVAIPQLAELDAARFRQKGILLVAFGLGLLILAIVSSIPSRVLIGFASIFILLGLGMLLEYRLRVRDSQIRNAPPQN